MPSLDELQATKAKLAAEKDAAVAKVKKRMEAVNAAIASATAAAKLEAALEGMSPEARLEAIKAVSK